MQLTGHALSREKRFAQGRLKSGVMNDSEAAYARHLDELKLAGVILWWKFEGVKLRLADNSFYNCDFFVMLADGELQAHEVKGQWIEDAKLKIKMAAELYPFRFVALRTVPKSRGGGWQVEDFSKETSPPLPGLRMKSDVPPPVKRPKPTDAPQASAQPIRRKIRRTEPPGLL